MWNTYRSKVPVVYVYDTYKEFENKTQRQSLKLSFILLNRNHQQQRWDRSPPDKHIIPIDCIYLPVNAQFHMKSNVCVSEFSYPSESKVCSKFVKIPSLAYWEVQKHRGIPQRSRWRFCINKYLNGKFQSDDVVGTFGKAFKVYGAFTGRCSGRYFANSRKNNFQIENEYFVDKLKHTNPWVPSF